MLSLFFVSVSAYAQTTRPSKPTEPIDLLTGAKWSYSLDGGKTFSATPPTIKARTTVHIQARTEFDVADTAGLVVLELTPNLPTRSRHYLKFFLNDKQIKPQMEGMNYKTYRAIDAKMLKAGKNILSAKIRLRNQSKDKDYQLKIAMRLAALKAEHLKIQTGPILGAFGKDYFTVVVRTNMPATGTLHLFSTAAIKHPPSKVMKTPAGLIHRFRVEGRERYHTGYNLRLSCRGISITHCGGPVPYPYQLRFVAMGDSRTYPKKWAKVADAVLKAKPDLVVFSGDMVNRGRNDWEWDEHFVANAQKLLATIPFYAVIGNHEHNAPVYPELFYTPGKGGRARTWSQEINGVLLIGIDGEKDFSAGSENYKWLEKTLVESKAKFIFAFNHYPAWSSSSHGRLDKETSRPREKTVRQAQDVLVPLLTKYKAAAYICGHDHCYERSELPGGLTHVISGGAGAPLRKKAENAEKQNPHSKVFASVLHYCIIEIKGDTCTMKAVTPDGKVIDTREWKARN